MARSTWSRGCRRMAGDSRGFRRDATGASICTSPTSGRTGFQNAKAFFPERRTAIDRYYYSAFDHAINPSWSPDGQRIYFVDNADVAWGSGDLWSVAVDDPQDRRRVLREETSWSARPELAPDGRRLALFELSRAAVASALAHDPRGCAAIAAHVRRVRCAKRALVAGRRAHCIHRQRERKHRADSSWT